MRVVCHSIEDFLENLEGCKLHDNTIWASITKNPLDGTKQDAAKFAVNFQASAVKQFSDGGECLVEMGIDCGMDYHDTTQDYEGSDAAAESKEKLKSYCDNHGLKLMPGILDM